MSKDQKGFIVYGNHEEILDRLTDEEAGKLLKAMTKYFNHGTEPKFDGALEFVWIPIRQQMDANAEKYEAKCQKNKESIQRYWNKVKGDTNEYERIRTSGDPSVLYHIRLSGINPPSVRQRCTKMIPK